MSWLLSWQWLADALAPVSRSLPLQRRATPAQPQHLPPPRQITEKEELFGGYYYPNNGTSPQPVQTSLVSPNDPSVTPLVTGPNARSPNEQSARSDEINISPVDVNHPNSLPPDLSSPFPPNIPPPPSDQSGWVRIDGPNDTNVPVPTGARAGLEVVAKRAWEAVRGWEDGVRWAYTWTLARIVRNNGDSKGSWTVGFTGSSTPKQAIAATKMDDSKKLDFVDSVALPENNNEKDLIVTTGQDPIVTTIPPPTAPIVLASETESTQQMQTTPVDVTATQLPSEAVPETPIIPTAVAPAPTVQTPPERSDPISPTAPSQHPPPAPAQISPSAPTQPEQPSPLPVPQPPSQPALQPTPPTAPPPQPAPPASQPPAPAPPTAPRPAPPSQPLPIKPGAAAAKTKVHARSRILPSYSIAKPPQPPPAKVSPAPTTFEIATSFVSSATRQIVSALEPAFGKQRDEDEDGEGKMDAYEKWARNVQSIVVVGIHGWFPGRLLQTVVGEPTGTSKNFAMKGAEAVRFFYRQRLGIELPPNAITMMPLEGEGKVENRVELLYSQLIHGDRVAPQGGAPSATNPPAAPGSASDSPQEKDDEPEEGPKVPSRMRRAWRKKLMDADLVFFAVHSQGTPVSSMLMARLIHEGYLDLSRQRVGILAMAGISHGPFPYLKSNLYVRYVEAEAARELFEFNTSNSLISRRYHNALRQLLSSGVRLTAVGSWYDQVVPLYSATLQGVDHPHVYRCIYIDGADYVPDFLTALIVFGLKIRNAGMSDQGLLVHLSDVLAGNLYGFGTQGHATVYGDLGVYTTAVAWTVGIPMYNDDHPSSSPQTAPEYLRPPPFPHWPKRAKTNHPYYHHPQHHALLTNNETALVVIRGFHAPSRLNPYWLPWILARLLHDPAIVGKHPVVLGGPRPPTPRTTPEKQQQQPSSWSLASWGGKKKRKSKWKGSNVVDVDEEDEKGTFEEEVKKVLRLFTEWEPVTKAGKELQYRLEPVKSKL
ncbi:hypothetical protein BJ742DRAFT_846737 [Cladochytrium replicatum]|nr:hypothetical protein BJ742DRAFT_846737 [Cladochytrium replicatum]